MIGRRGLGWLVAGVALALLVGRWIAGLYGGWAFHDALGSGDVWREALTLDAALRLGAFGAAFLFCFANLFAVRRSIVALVLPRALGGVSFGESVPTGRLTVLAAIVAGLVAALFGLADHDWVVLAQALHGLPFGEIDPYLARDLGFYVHWLPFERHLFEFAAVLTAVTAVLVLVAYGVTPSVRWDAEGLYLSTWVRRHLGVLTAVAIGLVAWDWRLERFALLSDGSGSARFAFEARPFIWFDHAVMLPYLATVSFLALPVAVVVAMALWRGATRLAFGFLTALLLGGPVTHVILPWFAGRPPKNNEVADARRAYDDTRLLYSRRAFGVDQVVSSDSVPFRPLDDAELARWVSAWDPAALQRSVEFQRRGTAVAALAWRGGPTGLDAELLRLPPAEAAPGTPWPTDRLRGDGADATGAPRPGVAAASGGIAGVLVYPGAPRWALVADTTGHLAAPAFETGLQRLMQAWDHQNPRLLAREAPGPRPRIMTERDALARLDRVAPFLTRGDQLTTVVRGDSLYWVAELFSTAAWYPLSGLHIVGGRPVHYAQHAATAVVQAQTGAVMLLPVAHPDPVVRTWMRRFPNLFTARENAPRWMQAGLPPALDWALVQGAMIARTGSRGDTLPLTQLLRPDDADADLLVGPATLFQMDTAGTLAWGVPVAAADGLAGLVVATGGLRPRTALIAPGTSRDWKGILEELQEAADAAGIGRMLPHSRRGRVQAIPTRAGPAFVQSFYEWPPDGPPRLAGVVVHRGANRRVGRTLADALGQPTDPWSRELPAEVLRAQASELYDAMNAAQRAGDWRAFGEAWSALGRLLGRPARP